MKKLLLPENWAEFLEQLRNCTAALFLDYDGTLVDIVDEPGQAELSNDQRHALERVAAVCPVAILTGRTLDDIRQRVAIPQLTYAAVHGYEIAIGESGKHLVYAADIAPVMNQIAAQLRARLDGVPDIMIENKRFAIAVHYRKAPAYAETVRDAIEHIIRDHSSLSVIAGKCIVEIRPNRPWNKGYALQWIMEASGLHSVLPVVIGDDTTDEDAFAVVAESGIAIAVGETAAQSSARYSVDTVADVYAILHAVEMQQSAYRV